MLNKIKQWFKKPEPVKNTQTKKETKKKKVEATLSPKELATQNNEPYINIIRVEVDPNDINNGSFELDWNDKFVLNLIRAGYKIRADDTEQMIVDRWFQTVCRNIALEIYEQQQADPEKRDDVRVIRSRDIGNGRSEIS
jgi:hypothetical protein